MFYKKLAKIINSNQSKSIFLSGNVYDLFNDGTEFVPLIDYLVKKCSVKPNDSKGKTVLVYQINKSLSVEGNISELRDAWNTTKKFNKDDKNSFDNILRQTFEESTLCIEFLRQLTAIVNKSKLKNDLVILIEGANILLPNVPLTQLASNDRRRIGAFYDWLSDPDFINGNNSVILITESESLINPMISKLPVMASVDIPAPSLEERQEYAQYLIKKGLIKEIKHDVISAGLTLYAYRQILLSDDDESVIDKVQQFISSQLGDDVVEFKTPTHKLKDLIGFKQLKKFLVEELIPGFQIDDDSALTGAVVGGPIGSGKTHIFEAVAAELGMIVLVLKNLRSQWYGQTDVIFERLRRLLMALDKVCIFIDEADTQFGGVGQDTHETERRLTGKIQGMMSDTTLKGKVVWLLMTARINLLSPDIRRPGRVGDLIIPVLDPIDEERPEFMQWVCKGVELQGLEEKKFLELTRNYSVASYSTLRAMIKRKKAKTGEEVLAILDDLIMPDSTDVRRYQTLQALLNCTRKSLLPQEARTIEERKLSWAKEAAALEPKIHY